MPRFFFHVRDDVAALDLEGKDLPDLEAAYDYALSSARALASAEVLEGRLALRHRIEIANANGCKVATVLFRDAIEVID